MCTKSSSGSVVFSKGKFSKGKLHFWPWTRFKNNFSELSQTAVEVPDVGMVMALSILVLCTLGCLAVSTVVMGVPHFINLLTPSRWVVIGSALVLVTFLMRD